MAQARKTGNGGSRAGNGKGKGKAPSRPTTNARTAAVAPAPQTASARDQARIAEVAYLKAERRGFAPGRELDDWLEAERELGQG